MDNIKEKTIVIAGVSGREDKFGFRIFRDLLNNGFKVKGINPRAGQILGEKIYRNLKELERPPDLLITVVPYEITERMVRECRELGIKEIWMQPGSESEKAVEQAKKYGIKVTYQACFMVENGIW